MPENNLLSTEEQEELKAAIAEAEAEGKDGDEPEVVEAKPDDKTPPPDKNEAKPEPEKAEVDDDPLPQLEEAAPAKRDERMQLLVADDTAEAEREIEQIKAYRTKLHDQFSEGELDQKEYAKKLDEAQDRMSELTASIREAHLAARTNEASTKQLWMDTVDDYRSQYKELQTKSVNAAWDYHIKAMQDDPKVKEMLANGERPGKVFRYVLKEAHKTVRTELGLGNKPNEVRDSAPGPKSLAGLPSATPSSTGSDEFADIDSMTGVEAEKALARMPADKKERYLTRITA